MKKKLLVVTTEDTYHSEKYSGWNAEYFSVAPVQGKTYEETPNNVWELSKKDRDNQFDVIKVVTVLSEAIAQFYNRCENDGCKGFVTFDETVPAAVRSWTVMALAPYKEVKFINIK